MVTDRLSHLMELNLAKGNLTRKLVVKDSLSQADINSDIGINISF